ncbi:transcription regulator hth arac- type [Lucifera butyrica]|uniref:Transcription regulator hth arac- type n=1 Tax=Lucifera butyrica TaxID=1351585 RepID=A0A498REK2_9FIRM|nr:PocR ligand-binding domain-containing protein [Lucifera butyrica]VBB07608.1 transcription regulator hth arac- type [Lucifera butyrica]
MELRNEAGFDLKRVQKSLQAYSRSTGVESYIVDAKGNFLYESCLSGNLCQFCNNIQSVMLHRPSCASVHLYGSYQAERFGGKYIYFCPIGMVHWASPLIHNGTIQGALVGGPVLMLEPDQFLLGDLIKKNGIDDTQLEKFDKYVQNVPVIPPDIVDSLSELLFLVATGLSDHKTSPHEAQRQYHKIQARISETIHHIKLLEDNEKEPVTYPFDKEKELLAKISLGDKAASQKILNEILGYVLFASGKDLEVIKARVMELVVLLSRAAVEGGADSTEIFGLNYEYLSEIQNFKTVEEITFWCSRIMARFTDCVFNLAAVRHKDTIYKAVDFIKKNYMKRITLEEVANHVYLNSSYFSKIFKSEMKCTFVSYVNKIRINASKNLLLDISIPLTDVSNLIGFEDQSYFTKVFKKTTGVTPGKFRESRGQSA